MSRVWFGFLFAVVVTGWIVKSRAQVGIWPPLDTRSMSPADEYYGWIAANRLLIVRRRESGAVVVERNLPAGDERVTGVIPSRYDAWGSSFSLSPDGTRLLWDQPERDEAGTHADEPELKGPGVYVVMSLDPSHRVEVWKAAAYRDRRSDWPVLAFWMSDSRRWVEVIGRDSGCSAIIHDLNSPNASRHIELPDIVNVSHVLGVTPGGHLIFLIDHEDGHKAHVLDVDLNTPPPTNSYPEMGFSSEMSVWDAALSPDGGRLAWVLCRPGYAGLWISSLRTGKAGEVYIFPPSTGDWIERGIQWTPDSQQISFVSENRLSVLSPTKQGVQ